MILMIFTIISSMLIYLQELRENKWHIEQLESREIGLAVSQLQNILYNRLTAGDEEEAQLSLSLMSMRPYVRVVLLVDGQGKVMMSNRFAWKGSPASAHSLYSAEEASLVLQSGVSKLAFNTGQTSVLQGYYPLIVSYTRGGLEKRMGLLYVESDIRRQLQEASRDSLIQSLIFALISSVSALLVAYVLHRLVSKRVATLSAVARRITAGDYSAHTNLVGNDELAKLGQNFDKMALQIGQSIELSEQAMLDQKRVLHTAQDGYWKVDGEGWLREVNDAYCRMSGYSQAELLQMDISQLEAKEQSLAEVRAHMEYILVHGGDQFDSLHRRKDGSVFDVQISTSYWKDKHEFYVFIRDISASKIIERELQASKEQYDRLTTNIPIGVYLLHTNQDGRMDFKYVSQRFCMMLGVEAVDVYRDSRTAIDPIHPDDLDEFMHLNQVAMRELTLFRWEGRVVVNHQIHWFRIESSPEPVGGGECVWDGVISDITKRKHIELDLQLEQGRLKEAQKIGHFGSWELDFISGKLIWSEENYHLFEIDETKFDASYEAFLHAIHPDDRDDVNAAYNNSLLDKKPYQIVHRLLMHDGRIKWVEERCSSVFDASGNPLRSIGTVQDVTEREEMEEQARIAAVAFETQEAMIVTDRSNRIIKVNSAFKQITGYQEEDVIGQNPRILSSGRHDDEFYRKMWAEIIQFGRWSGEVLDKRKDGSVYPKWLTITAVKYRDEVTHYVAVFVDITDRKRAEEEIRNLAFFDPLTQLPNRRLMLDRLHLSLGQSRRSGHHCALMFLDLDHFKLLNDTRGHDYGDMMLREVARRMNECVRETDSVARFGGDEFVVLLESLSLASEEAVLQAGHVAEKIRDSLSQPYQLKESQHLSSPSIGVVIFKGDAVNSDVLLKQADMAMYRAKDSGRNMVRFFEPAMQAALESRTLLEGALRSALENGELKLFYQLQTNKAMELLGAEVLLRWNSPTLGMVSPAQFIPVAEQTKLILPIGHWVLEQACKQLKSWERDPVLCKMHLAVNISPVQFHQKHFVEQIKAVLESTGADPRRLELELTENLVLEDVDEATEKMQALKQIGVRFSMDDFGTGYSSLQYIKRLPIDQLKIDQSFVRDILTDPGDAVMVQTISDLARNFGFDVIAEGVETEDQLPSLIERGCDMFQGYLFSRPVSIDDFETLVQRWNTP
jgi:diguanylate cyclase (GGDEF)-like protein/PAS domain S-box-containing protein